MTGGFCGTASRRAGAYRDDDLEGRRYMSKSIIDIEETPENSGGKWRKGKRYQGYDLDKTLQKRSKRPWFWKILGISLLLTAVVILAVCGFFFQSNQRRSSYISEINDANTMDNLLSSHENVLITVNYSHLANEEDYKTTRFVRKTGNGDYYSYYKTDGMEEDYREVIRGKQLYRYDGNFVYYYGLLGDDYENVCVSQIEGEVFQTGDSVRITDEQESGDFLKVTATYTVAEGDEYATRYGFNVGDQIEQTLTLDKETMVVLTAVETCNGEEFYSYTVEFDGSNKNPEFYQNIKDQETDRECTVYYDYQGDNEETYTFNIPRGVYFNLLEHDGYTVYSDEDCDQEFTEYQMQVQNPETDITLYVKQNEE